MRQCVLGLTLPSAGQCEATDRPRPLPQQQLKHMFLAPGHAVLRRSVRSWCGGGAGMCRFSPGPPGFLSRSKDSLG